MMASGHDIDDQYPGRLLQQAAIYNNVDLLDSLLEGPEKRNVNAQDNYGRTALYTSITNNSFECMEKLLMAGADANISCGLQCGGMSPLHAAALDNKDRFVHLLLEYNADVNKLDASGECPLALAVTNRSNKCVQIISEQLERNAELKASFENDFVEACRSGNLETAKNLLHGTILSRDDALRLANEHNLLRISCEYGFVDVCEFLLETGTRIEIDSTTSHSPFHVACVSGNGSCARTILRSWPDQADVPTSDGFLAIHLACIHGHVHVVKLLFEFLMEKAVTAGSSASQSSKAAVMNVCDGRRRTPLHLAVRNNQLKVVEYVLKELTSGALSGGNGVGSDKNSFSLRNSGEQRSSSEFRKRTVKIDKAACSRQQSKEISDGADVDVEDDEGKTPLHYAIIGGETAAFFDVAATLLQYRADPNRAIPLVSGAISSSPLMEAFKRSDRALMSLLLRHGAKDDDLKITSAAVEADDDEMIGVMIQYHSYLDADYKPNYLMIAQLQHDVGRSNGIDLDFSRSMSVNASGITINWHALGLRKIIDLWVLKACAHQMKKSHLCTDSVIKNQAVALVFITRIDISENSVEILPDFLWRLPSLRFINASNNKISTIVESKRNATSDGAGSMEDCLQGADEFLLNCPSLEEINLCKNRLGTVPIFFFRMPALKRLNVSHNAVEILPIEMWTSISLLELNLAHNDIRTLPFQTEDKLFPDVRSTPSSSSKPEEPFQSFDTASSNNRTSTTSALQENAATRLSNGIADNNSVLSDLQSSRQNDRTLLKHVSRWQDKVGVQPSDDFDGQIDPKLERRSQLLELNLSHNELEDLPAALPCLAPQLEKLVLSHNRLSQIDCASIFPASLKSLDLSHNQIAFQGNATNAIEITKSPTYNAFTKNCYSPYTTRSSVSQMSLLHSRSVSSTFQTCAWNGPTCKHRFHFRLERLKALKLNNNKIRKFAVCLEANDDMFLSSDESVRTVDSKSPLWSPRQRSNQISGHLEKKKSVVLYPNLTSLDLSHNDLVCLTSDICELAQLAELKVSHNKIKELPTEMALMRRLWNVDFSNCPVADSLRSLLGDKVRKTSAVLGYLKSIRDEAVPFNRMKLMLVGVQGIGKTSLLNQLRDKKTKNTHWVERMGHKTQGKDQKGENISTVGVDIGDLVIQGPTGKVIFSTWDFGGQKEYYATHQYFLSKRSLYLVVWKVTDGEKGVNEILQWLINIQARVPGSPVIIVGTHRDLLPKKNRDVFLKEMDGLIRKKYLSNGEPDKLGLPRICGNIVVSCKHSFMSRTYIPELRSLIWDVVSEKQLPGGKRTPLLEQKVPARYLHLQVIVETLAKERKEQSKDPVLHADQYKHMVVAKMEEMYKTCFQDMAELSQATQFLHENGVLLHYDEVHLQDVYFLDPQWLCDMLANIITIREINSLAKSGVMKTDHVRVLFKGVAFKANDIKTYMINLLQKFEVALLWDQDHLLIPSLLPTESDVVKGIPDSCVIIPIDHSSGSNPKSLHPNEIGYGRNSQNVSNSCFEGATIAANESKILSSCVRQSKIPSSCDTFPAVTNVRNRAVSLVRLYLMSYFPCGFWPRLITRLLGDKSFVHLASTLYSSDSALSEVVAALDRLKSRPQWQCWQTGLELQISGITILRLKEVSCSSATDEYDYESRRLLVKHEDDCTWSAIDSRLFSVLEIFIPNDILCVEISGKDGSQIAPSHLMVYPEMQTVAALLATVVDRIDTLLEDWYPDIGNRFEQNTKGTYLITRLVPCIRCLLHQDDSSIEMLESWVNVSESSVAYDTGSVTYCSLPSSPSRLRSGADSGAGSPICACSPIRTGSPLTRQALLSSSYESRRTLEGCSRHAKNSDGFQSAGSDHDPNEGSEVDLQNGTYCFLFEACIQAVQANRVISCPIHGNLGPYFTASETGQISASHIAPDAIFQDVGKDRLVEPDAIKLERFLGRGAFGAVFGGTVVNKVTGDAVPVAMKVLQPVKPTGDASPSQLQQYKIDKGKWDRDPIKSSCEAYLNARKELGILLALNHPYIVPLLGFSVTPLSLILSLAPQGDLNSRLKDYERAGTRLPICVMRDVIVQVASALQYLHSLQVIYRDLKSENVLVWSLPPPHSDVDDRDSLLVDVKLADYGVCRVVLPVGTKGFAGTLPFMAPEIIQHNGYETYTEKVDCFSFGMFIYELLLLKPPYEDTGSANGSNINLKSHVMSGGRPMITSKETVRQKGILDLMTLCWSHDPNDRPSAKEIVDFAQSPEFCATFNAIRIENAENVACACSARRKRSDVDAADDQMGISSLNESDVWLSLCSTENSSGSIVVCTYQEQECVQIKKLQTSFPVIRFMCVTNTDVWCATSGFEIYVFRLGDYKEICKFPSSSQQGTSVRCMVHSATEDRVYVVLDEGNIVVCSASFPANLEPSYTPAIKEYPGNGKPIHCVAIITTSVSATELWCGQGNGKICIWNLESSGENARLLNHFNSAEVHVDTVHLVTSFTDSFTLYSYVYPGTTLYCWDTLSKSLLAMVDLIDQVSLKLPGSNALQNSNKFKATKWQVTCMNIVDQFLYVGTTGGCLVVINRHSMMPLTLCRPHSDGFPNILAVLPLSFPEPLQPWETSLSMQSNANEEESFPVFPRSGSLFVTIGKGYKDVAANVMPKYATEKANEGIFVIVWSSDEWPSVPATSSPG